MRIRFEAPADIDAIHALTETAFAPMPYSSGAEATIVDRLRAAGDLSLSLVAEDDDHIIGHAAFSPVAIGDVDDGWYGLGPVSVAPRHQRQGIGRSLILRGLGLLRARGAHGCTVVGNPGYYGRIGFVSDGKLTYPGFDLALVQRIVFLGTAPTGALAYAPAFG